MSYGAARLRGSEARPRGTARGRAAGGRPGGARLPVLAGNWTNRPAFRRPRLESRSGLTLPSESLPGFQ